MPPPFEELLATSGWEMLFEIVQPKIVGDDAPEPVVSNERAPPQKPALFEKAQLVIVGDPVPASMRHLMPPAFWLAPKGAKLFVTRQFRICGDALWQ